MDCDIVAAMNVSSKPSPRLRGSRDGIDKAQSGTFEPAMTEPEIPVIRIVDMSKSTLHQRY